MYAQLHSSSKGICIASILTFISLMFNVFNTSRKFRGGENRKTEIQKKEVGEAEFLYLYYSTIISNGGRRGWGSWGRLLYLVHLACRSSAPPPSCYPSPDKPTAFFKRYWFFSSGDIMLSAKWSLAAERAVSFMVCDTIVL